MPRKPAERRAINLIDCEEDRALWAVFLGMLRDAKDDPILFSLTNGNGGGFRLRFRLMSAGLLYRNGS